MYDTRNCGGDLNWVRVVGHAPTVAALGQSRTLPALTIVRKVLGDKPKRALGCQIAV